MHASLGLCKLVSTHTSPLAVKIPTEPVVLGPIGAAWRRLRFNAPYSSAIDTHSDVLMARILSRKLRQSDVNVSPKTHCMNESLQHLCSECH